jgi:hypothetical protein
MTNKQAYTLAARVLANEPIKVYIVIEDAFEQTTKLVTTDSRRAHKLAQELTGEDEVPKPALDGSWIYTDERRDLFVRVEEHEVQS